MSADIRAALEAGGIEVLKAWELPPAHGREWHTDVAAAAITAFLRDRADGMERNSISPLAQILRMEALAVEAAAKEEEA